MQNVDDLEIGFPDEENNPILVMPTKIVNNGEKLF